MLRFLPAYMTLWRLLRAFAVLWMVLKVET